MSSLTQSTLAARTATKADVSPGSAPDVAAGDSTTDDAGRLAASEELRAWYAHHLRPKLERAAQSGRILSAHAIALDQEMKSLLQGFGSHGAPPEAEATSRG